MANSSEDLSDKLSDAKKKIKSSKPKKVKHLIYIYIYKHSKKLK